MSGEEEGGGEKKKMSSYDSGKFSRFSVVQQFVRQLNVKHVIAKKHFM